MGISRDILLYGNELLRRGVPILENPMEDLFISRAQDWVSELTAYENTNRDLPGPLHARLLDLKHHICQRFGVT